MKKKFKYNLFLAIIIISIIISFITLNVINKIVMPVFSNYVSSELKNIIVLTINDTVKKEISNKLDYNELMVVTKNEKEEIQSIDFNSALVNKVLNNVTSTLLVNINNIELNNNFKSKKINKKTIYEVPIGVISENIFLSNLGPRIPINYKIIGNATSNINTSIKEYGINNALLTISIITNMTLEINVPFIKKKVNVEVENPIIMKVIQGSVPNYYGGLLSRNSNLFTIPIS